MLYKMCGRKNPLDLTEFKIVLFSLQDYTNKEIADKLSMSDKNVETMLNIIFKKLGVKKKCGMIGACWKRGILNINNC